MVLKCSPCSGKAEMAGTMLYSVEAKDAPAVAGEGKPRRHPLSDEHGLVKTFQEDVKSLYHSFKRTAENHGCSG